MEAILLKRGFTGWGWGLTPLITSDEPSMALNECVRSNADVSMRIHDWL